jgi:methionyl-tRNA formyltransferase
MARVIVIGGIESTYRNAQVLNDLGEEIIMFYTRGPNSPGWEGVDLIDESPFTFVNRVPRTIVEGNINEYVEAMRKLRPHFIYSLGWQQFFRKRLREICPVIGLHESLLPAGAGPVPIANAILHDFRVTGCTLFWVDGGIDTGPIIGQLKGRLDPRTATATELYEEAIVLGGELLRTHVPQLISGRAPAIPQDFSKRTAYQKIRWEDWPEDKVARARVYPYA